MALETVGKPRMRCIPLVQGSSTFWWQCSVVKVDGDRTGTSMAWGFRPEEAYERCMEDSPILYPIISPMIDDIPF